MDLRITGLQITALRKALQLSGDHFAAVLGVRFSTLYRWEAFGSKETSPIDGLPRVLLLSLRQQVRHRSRDSVRKAGLLIHEAITSDGGTLMALERLARFARGGAA